MLGLSHLINLLFARALATNLRRMRLVQGGSTITQQLAKNFFLTPERTIRRKAQEALLAFVLERKAIFREARYVPRLGALLALVGAFAYVAALRFGDRLGGHLVTGTMLHAAM